MYDPPNLDHDSVLLALDSQGPSCSEADCSFVSQFPSPHPYPLTYPGTELRTEPTSPAGSGRYG